VSTGKHVMVLTLLNSPGHHRPALHGRPRSLTHQRSAACRVSSLKTSAACRSSTLAHSLNQHSPARGTLSARLPAGMVD